MCGDRHLSNRDALARFTSASVIASSDSSAVAVRSLPIVGFFASVFGSRWLVVELAWSCQMWFSQPPPRSLAAIDDSNDKLFPSTTGTRGRDRAAAAKFRCGAA